jgi:hypothetical protein
LNGFRSSLHRGGDALPAVPAGDLAWISVAQMREVDRLAIEHRLGRSAGAQVGALLFDVAVL